MRPDKQSAEKPGEIDTDALSAVPDESIISLAEQYGPSFGKAFAGFIQEMARAPETRSEQETRRAGGVEERSGSTGDPIGDEIRKRITESGRPMKEIAAAMKKHPSAVSKLIKKASCANLATLKELADVLGLEVVDLLPGQKSPRTAT